MKKILLGILILCLIFPACCAASDLTGMTDDELTTIYESARAEMISRGLFKEAILPAGAYYAGSFLPEGTYVITLPEGGCDVQTFSSYQAYLNGEKYISRSWLTEGQSFTMILTGETCYYIEEQMTITPAGMIW